MRWLHYNSRKCDVLIIIKHHGMNTYWRVALRIHAFVTSCCSYVEVKRWFRTITALFSSQGFAEITGLKCGLATGSWAK
jgi:hypothetical protein